MHPRFLDFLRSVGNELVMSQNLSSTPTIRPVFVIHLLLRPLGSVFFFGPSGLINVFEKEFTIIRLVKELQPANDIFVFWLRLDYVFCPGVCHFGVLAYF